MITGLRQITRDSHERQHWCTTKRRNLPAGAENDYPTPNDPHACAPRPVSGQLAMPMPIPGTMHGSSVSPDRQLTPGASSAPNLWLIVGTLVIAAIVGFLANMWLLAQATPVKHLHGPA